jgi:hypothetical protein
MSDAGAGVEGALLTAKELAERLGGVSVGSVYKMSARGLIPSQPWGPKKGGRRFVERDVRAALAALHQPLKEYHAPRLSA